MALTPTLTYSSETLDGGIYLSVYEDSTEYGGANAERADVAVYLTSEKINADGTVANEVTVESYDPTTATSFTLEIEEDGWYKSKFIIIPDYDELTAYVQYDAVYHNGVVYRALGATTGNEPPNVTYWEVIDEPTSLVDNDGGATESGNIVFEIKENIIYPYAKTAYGDMVAEASIDCCNTCDRPEKVLDYEYIGVLVDGMDVRNQRSQFASGERIARKSQEFINDHQ